MRLVRARDFERMFASAQRSTDDLFTVLARRNRGDLPRLGLAVSRKHVKTAVKRNRIKRLVRESFRAHRRELVGLDIVVVARAGLNTAERQRMVFSLDRHWMEIRNQCRRP